MTKKAKNTRNNPAFATREEFEAKVDQIAILMVKQSKKAAALDAKLQKMREPLETEILELDGQIKAGLALCESYALTHRNDLLTGKAKSAKTTLATWSLKIGKESIICNEGSAWDDVITRAHELGHDQCLRNKEEVDKIALAKLSPEQLEQYPVRVKPAVESFGIKPKDNAIDEQ